MYQRRKAVQLLSLRSGNPYFCEFPGGQSRGMAIHKHHRQPGHPPGQKLRALPAQDAAAIENHLPGAVMLIAGSPHIWDNNRVRLPLPAQHR